MGDRYLIKTNFRMVPGLCPPNLWSFICIERRFVMIKIFVIGGTAGSGKSTLGELLKEELELIGRKPCIMHITNPLYNYAKNYFNWDGNLKIKVTGRNDDVNKHISLMTVGTIYMGHVTKYSPKSENYTITLTNGVRAIVPAQRVQNNLKLAYGDKVSVVIYQIYPNYVSGNAMKI